MAELKCKTRKGVDPQGKSRVYFSCHPRDFERYFDTVTDDILLKENCAIYCFESEVQVTDEEMEDALDTMQLIVIPITARFLYQNNRSRVKELEFAKKNGIAVLPLMKERNLDREFNRICGDLQFLDEFANDPTAISFNTKLSNFLKSVLVSDELAKRVRAAFDAYIFLSYRKKDRKYAKELMRLIHKNDFCRDIAIWYDEYLVPGENFNDSIADAIKKSKLFALVVTPNLINESNYVANEEYPMAKKLNMTVLPAEAVLTDRAELEKQFPELPECINAEDEIKLSEALLENLHHIAVSENDSSPEHIFLIGLAYLSGIDVETDYKKAAELIEKAAEAGVLEAAEKLLDMYKTATGVKMDYENIIKWSHVLRLGLKEKISQAPEEGLQKKYLFTTAELCGVYEKLEKYDEAITLAEKTINEFSCETLNDDEKELFYSLKCLMAIMLMKTQKFDRAKEIFDSSEAEIEQLAASDFNKYARGLAFWYNSVGSLYHKELKYTEAKKYFNNAIKISAKIMQDTDMPFHDIMALFYDNLADVYSDEGDFKHAAKYSLFSVEIYEKLSGIFFERYGYHFAVACDNLGMAYYRDNMFAEAKTYLDKAEETFKKLKESLGHVYARDVAKNFGFLGNWHYSGGEYKKALRYYLKAVRINKKYADSGDYEYLLAENYSNMALLYKKCGKFEKSAEFNIKALEMRKKLCEDNPDVYKKDVANSYNNLAMVYVEENNPKRDLEAAIENYLESVRLYKEAYENERKMPDHIFATVYENLGMAYMKKGDGKRAAEIYEELIPVRKNLIKKKVKDQNGFLAIDYYFLAEAYEAAGESGKALKQYQEAVKLFEKLNAATRGDYWKLTALAYFKACKIYLKAKKTAEAKRAVKRSLELYKLTEMKQPGSAASAISEVERFIYINKL